MTAHRFTELDSGLFVRLSPFGSYDEPTDWHVNGGIAALAEARDLAPGSTTEGRVLQRADASPEWLVVVVRNEGDGWRFKEVRRASGETFNPEHIDELDILDTAEDEEGLSDAN